MSPLLNNTIILESITHLEDLPLNEFIRTVESLKDKIVTEKLDGANLWFGLDENGLFTSREGKSPKKARFYNVGDYQMVANYNSFRATHLALEQVEPTIKKHLKDGDMVEIEVLYGRQPNTVTYGVSNKNFIVLLRGVNGTPSERVDALANALKNKTVNVTSTVISSTDGNTLESNDEQMTWEFVQVKPIDAEKIDTSEVITRLAELKKFSQASNKLLPEKTNQEVVELSLTSVPKAEREAAKSAREKTAEYIQTEFKKPIKELLLTKFVRKIKPFLQADDLHPSEDIGVEGVVVRDPVSGAMTKIVDKDIFTAINTFNSSVRAEVAGLVRTTDQDATLELRGGSFGQAKIRIADILGAKELALSSGVKRFVTKFKQNDVVSTAEAIAESLNILNLQSIKIKISAILKNSLKEVNSILDSFKKDAGTYKLQLKTGKEIGISPEVMKRTLTAFAETKKDIAEVNSRVIRSETPGELVLALYGKTIESLFEGDGDMKENFAFMKSIIEDGEAASADTTVSGDIAPVPFKLIKGKVITRRPRNFVKIKKFAQPEAKMENKLLLMKAITSSITEDAAVGGDMAFAKDVDDKANSQNNIEFKKLRNNVAMGQNINQTDVSKYLDKATELNDEVDTVTFGMETDDGSVVKIYVNAAQADNFEETLSELLGQEDDVAEVINTLANTYDIVDVEWPESLVKAVDDIPTDVNIDDVSADTSPDDVDSDDLSATDDVPEPESNEEPDFSINDNEELADEEPSSDEELTDLDPSVSSDEDEDEEPAGDEENEDEELTDLDPTASSDDEEEPTENEEESEDDSSPKPGGLPKKKHKKPKTPTEESMQSFGEKFLQRVLNEGKEKKNKEEEIDNAEDPAVVASREKLAASVDKILASVPKKQDKAIVTLLLALGVPQKALLVHKAELKNTVEAAGELYLKNNSFKMWVNKFLTSMKDADEVTESESFEKRLNGKYPHLIYNLIVALGMPEGIESTFSGPLLKSIHAKAKQIQVNNKARTNLNMIADIMGVADKTRNMADTDMPIKESVLLENMDDANALMMKLFTTFGFDPAKTTSISRQMMMPQVKSKMLKFAAKTSAVTKMQRLTDFIDQQLAGPETSAPVNKS
jgi:hypothetical protein